MKFIFLFMGVCLLTLSDGKAAEYNCYLNGKKVGTAIGVTVTEAEKPAHCQKQVGALENGNCTGSPVPSSPKKRGFF